MERESGTIDELRMQEADFQSRSDGDWGFRSKPITDSGRNRSPNPVQTDRCQSGATYTGNCWFCDQYRAWAAKLDLVMRQEHRAGEKLFIDYAGQTVPVVDRETGEVREAQIFVAVLGASSYTFAVATWTQTLRDWTASHARAFEFFGGCPELVIYDYGPLLHERKRQLSVRPCDQRLARPAGT